MSLETSFGLLRNANILMTGATGWFGVWLLDALITADDLLKLGLIITGVSRDPSAFLAKYSVFQDDSRLRWIKSDVAGLVIKDATFSHVIHAAADSISDADPVSRLRLFSTMIDGTRHLIEATGSRCRKVLLISSGAVYGPERASNSPCSEANIGGPDPFQPDSAYAEGKRAMELIGAIAASNGFPVCVARCFTFVGPHMAFNKHFAIGNFIADAVDGRMIRVKSDGRSKRSYLYMTDLVRALLRILVDGQPGRAYNVGGDESVTIGELAALVDRVVGGCGTRIEGASSDTGHHYVPDISRLQSELQFKPEVSLEAAICRTAEWYRQRMAGANVRS